MLTAFLHKDQDLISVGREEESEKITLCYK